MASLSVPTTSGRGIRRPSAADRILELAHHGGPQEHRFHVRLLAFFFFLVGGLEALLIRLQLTQPEARS